MRRSAAIFLAIVAAAVARLGGAEPATAPAPPRLAVLLIIDQGRADYLERFAPYFVDGGFRRLLEGGANFANCHYEHAATKTAVGHATIATGAHPAVHGIVANEWFDANTWQLVNSVADDDAPIIGGAPNQGGRSPRQLLADTVADQLKSRYGNNARVFAVANKDRSAILPAGKHADGAFWLGDNDVFVSSHYYFPDDRLPAWVEAFNARGPVAAYFGRTWDRLLAADAYEQTQGPDDAAGEFAGLALGRVFPRTINGGKETIGREFSDAFDRTPFGLEIVARFAREIVEHEQLGADAVPDLLSIGFSQIDTVGHDYGPDSHEVMDSFLRLDRLIAELLSFLDEKVGANRYVVVVTADHGIPPMPERLQAQRPELVAQRVDLRELDRAVTAALIEAFGPAPENRRWCIRDNAGYRISAEALGATGASLAQAVEVVKKTLLAQPVVADAFTADELAVAPMAGDAAATWFRRSYHAPRSPDVVFGLKPYHVARVNSGSDHGSRYDYDSHVPLLWYGPGVPRRGRVTERVGMTDLAPTLSALLGLKPPSQATGRQLFQVGR